MAEEIVRVAEEDVVRMAANDDHVVGDESMSAIDEIERALALADAAVPEEEDADAVDVEETGVQRAAWRHRLFEEVGRANDRRGGHRRRREERHGALLALLAKLIE